MWRWRGWLRWVLLAAVGVAVLIGLAVWIVRDYRTDLARQRAADAEISARADEQHGWTMAGDERGTYGEFPPAL